MYIFSEFGGISYELSSILQVASLSLFMGGLYGGISYSKEAYIEFIKNNQATAFKSHLDAKVGTLCFIISSIYLIIQLIYIQKILYMGLNTVSAFAHLNAICSYLGQRFLAFLDLPVAFVYFRSMNVSVRPLTLLVGCHLNIFTGHLRSFILNRCSYHFKLFFRSSQLLLPVPSF